jgi:hypothetical protein
MRESSFFKALPFQFLCLAIAAVVLAMIGPYGTFADLRLGSRLLYWGLSMGAGWLTVVPIAAAIDRVDRLQAWPIAGRMALAGVLGALPMTAVVWGLETLFRRNPPSAELPQLLLQVMVLAVTISVAVGQVVEFRLRSRAGAAELTPPAPGIGATAPAEGPSAAPAAAAPAPPPAALPASAPPDVFLRRLPAALGHDLLALEMEDHYVRVHTALGSTLILLRLRDAVTELGADSGLQVHRSWWVAQGSVARVEREAGKVTLVLRNDLRVPVSKTYREAIMALRGLPT